LATLIIAGLPLVSASIQPGNRGADGWTLACRLASYGKYQDAAWTHLPALGVHHLFLGVPRADEVDDVQKRLTAHRLKPLVLRGQADLGDAKCVEALGQQLAICETMGVRYMFLSPKHTGVDKETAWSRLRQAGEIARRHGVVIALETHPDLGTNADAHLETMRRVNHPNVRVNFDTGNITYYNEEVDVVAELEKIVDYVGTVELKDHTGKARTWSFPALGRGKIDFPGVLAVLKQHAYDGPITIEVEGIEGKPWTEAETKEAIAESVSYLRRLASFK
jgi:sugar phosphate isomerase/epimerase